MSLSKTRSPVTATQSAKLNEDTPQKQKKWQGDLAIHYGQYQYQEPKISMEGAMLGISGSFLMDVSQGLHLGARGDWESGETTYKGFYIDTQNTGVEKPLTATGKDSTYDVGGLAGLEVFRSYNGNALFYSGIAYRSHYNRVQNSAGYTREITQFYIPLGISGQVELASKWTLKSEGELDLLLAGKVKSYLSETGATTSDLEHHQNSGMGAKAMLRAVYTMTNWSLQFGPFYSFWRVEESDRVSARLSGRDMILVEPNNTTARYGFSLGVLF